MALENFKPVVWQLAIERQLEKIKVFENLVSTAVEGLVSQYGKSVRIPSIGRVTAASYSSGGTITYNNVDDKSQTLDIDQSYIAAIQMDDLDSLQALPGAQMAVVEEMALALRAQYDSSIAGLYSGVSAAQTVDYSSTSIDSGNIVEVLHEVRAKFTANEVSPDQRLVMVVDPYLAIALKNAAINRLESNKEQYMSNFITKVAGIECYESNAITVSGTYGTNYTTNTMIFTPGRAISAPRQKMPTVEALRSTATLADLLRAHMVWGRKIVRMDEVVYFKALVNKETTI